MKETPKHEHSNIDKTLQIVEFFTFAGVMIGNIVLFTWLVSRYKPMPVDLLTVITTPPAGKEVTDSMQIAQSLDKNLRV